MKTITQAKEEAKSLSRQHPDVTVYVMKKSRKGAVVSMNDWVWRERILDGWVTVCRFKNGEKV